jgi:hypothetical protein
MTASRTTNGEDHELYEEPDELEQPPTKRARRDDEHQGVEESKEVRVERERQRDIVERDELAKRQRENDGQRKKKIVGDSALENSIPMQRQAIADSTDARTAALPLMPLKNQEYTVGWICALPLEMAAARAMLDELHGRPREQHKQDQNTYYLGSIGQHNIAIACLPAGVYVSLP